ncbi:MAG: hypothetical protein AAF533_24515 [Acidobacteriota bacterium]
MPTSTIIIVAGSWLLLAALTALYVKRGPRHPDEDASGTEEQ